LQPIDDSRDAVFDEDHGEVDEQAETLVWKPETGKQLFFVDRPELAATPPR
jgi:hypothetical protein